MADDVPPAAAAGWYADADGGQRYWDGSAWTDSRVAAGQPLPGADTRGPDARAGDIVGAILVPPAGLIWGLLDLNTKPRSSWQIIITSVVAAVLWALILHGAL